jgi:PAS domain-containing protein
MVKADGSILWAHLTVTIVQKVNGESVCHIAMSDITENKQDKHNLRETNERFSDLVEKTDCLICSIDNEGKFNYINDMWGKIMI